VPDRLAIESGRPVLIVTHAAEAPGRVGESAKKVKVIWINPQLESEVALDIPAADICASARHNVGCDVPEHVKPRGSVGEMLLWRPPRRWRPTYA
jgi:hypothetical protein